MPSRGYHLVQRLHEAHHDLSRCLRLRPLAARLVLVRVRAQQQSLQPRPCLAPEAYTRDLVSSTEAFFVSYPG